MNPFSYACHLPCERDYLSKFQFVTHLSHFCLKASFFKMKFLKLVTWCPNMVQYTFNFKKNKKSLNYFLKYICVFYYTCTLHFFHKYIPISHFIECIEIIVL
jgi:Na+/H+-dicarboxylate symporter